MTRNDRGIVEGSMRNLARLRHFFGIEMMPPL